MFELTEEQINYITEYYGSSKRIIKNIELELNLLGIVTDEDDYYEIVATVAAQRETINEKLKSCTTKAEAMRVNVPTRKLILFALKEKYNGFENLSNDQQVKIQNYC